MTEEHKRLAENAKKTIPLEQWGPYLSERQWSTVREDYSANGDTWNYFPFDHAHCREYQWGEDGLAGISDRFQNLCFGISLWNGKDTVLKERLFGLRNGEGNHGEDVKELYYYLDNLPSHYYMQFLYKYSQQAFPYQLLRDENRKRSRQEPEYEILDTGVFNNQQYFDVLVTYAKQTPNDIFIRIDVTNRYSRSADITVMPTLWFFKENKRLNREPVMIYRDRASVECVHERLGRYYFYCNQPGDLLFTNNATNKEIVLGQPSDSIFTKDAFHKAVIEGKYRKELRDVKHGTKCAAEYKFRIAAGATRTIFCRLSDIETDNPFPRNFRQLFDKRKEEADEFYQSILPPTLSQDQINIHRQALAGLLWSKQYYAYDVEQWLHVGDGITEVTKARATGRNSDWQHLKNQDVIAMPDKWEYPWYAAWDLAFHCIAMAAVDPTFAKHQLLLIMREWYMKPDGQLPAYEWNFSDVNPPVHAHAAMQIYKIEKQKTGQGDVEFLKKIFQKLVINFTWWINRKDRHGNNIFEGGFLGLDNIGVFNRSHQFSGEAQLEQADGTSWMGTYALDMMDIALEIGQHDPSFEDMGTKFFEHFILIAESLNEHHLWDAEDKFFYDVLTIPGKPPIPLKTKSIVGLTSLFAVSRISKEIFRKLPDFEKRVAWFEDYRIRNNKFWPNEEIGEGEEMLLSLVGPDRLMSLLERLLDEDEFLSPGGVRALSKYHREHPYSVEIDGNWYTIQYDPGDSTSDIFGGNSNWRGPVWMPINFLVIKSIRRFGEFYGDNLKVECPTRSGVLMNLEQVADELTRRVLSLFKQDDNGLRRQYGPYNWFYQLPENRELMMFYEYFHGDDGRGLGACHQTGWTALIAELMREETTGDKLS